LKFKTILLLKKNKNHNSKIINFLQSLKVFRIKKYYLQKNDNLKFLRKENIDVLISYLSPCIIPEKILNEVKILKINFHPGPPLYPGLGCYNFALLNKDKKYGVTAHEMTKKVDSGKIFKVKYFPIKTNDNVETLIEKSYAQMFNLFKETMVEFKRKKVIRYSRLRWLRKPCNRKEFEKIFELKNFDNKKHILNVIRSTYLKGFNGPYIDLYGNKFIYSPDEKKK